MNPVRKSTHLDIPEERFGAIICYLHRPIDGHRPHCRTKPTYMFCGPPEHTRTLRRDRQCDIKILKVYFVIRSANYVFVDVIAREGADSCSQVEGSSNEPPDVKGKPFGVSLKQFLTGKNLRLREERCYRTAADLVEVMIW